MNNAKTQIYRKESEEIEKFKLNPVAKEV